MTAGLTERAMLVRFRVHQWSAKVTDHRVSDEVATTHNVSKDTGRYTKRLLKYCFPLEDWRRNANSARAYVNHVTLPWSDTGYRILPSKMFFEFRDRISKFMERSNELINELEEVYEERLNAERQRLGDMFNEDDYPSARELRNRFGFSLNFEPLPEAGDWRVDLGEEVIAEIKKQNEQRYNDALDAAMTDLWNRLYKPVNNMVERLSDPNSRFHRSLVTNVQDIVEVLPSLNLNDDPELNRLAEEARLALCAYSADDLREDDHLRNEIAAKAKEIAENMAPFLE